MVFSSVIFLYAFLPITLAVYFVVPKKLKNLVLLLASLVFYFFGEPIYVFLMIGSSLAGYLFGLWIDKARNSRFKKLPLVLSIVISLGLLGFFKYSDFLIENINGIFGSQIGLLRIALPIGISFYTFQILSYTVDVYRGDALVQKNFVDFAAYVALFPQLIAGPIVRYTTIEAQLKQRAHTFDKFASGVSRFTIGLGKKVLIANVLAELVASGVNNASVLSYWLTAIAFTLQIYFDFSGYSDMAIGLGRMFGFDFNENFNYPYASKSVTEFWRRWHMSLGTWFKDYVYIPLGGNRVSTLKWLRNILIVWLLTGLWHGSAWNFVVWGLMFAVLLIAEKLFLNKLLEKCPSFVRSIYLLFIITISFVIFNANSMTDAIHSLGGMFGAASSFIDELFIYDIRSYAVLIVCACIGATPLLKNLALKLKEKAPKLASILEPLYIVVVLLLCTAYIVDGSFNPFLYFRF